ncbi:hypothetical protein HCX49_12585 [Sphingobacterium kitahiroshimense]|uniref:hypothetical protein n=1 Tax=Sphingobacterium sp. B16(2022) TaxID=2914044 RepID=UPI00143BB301|nr:hypothetical protein [Sphingobacterium sp. B16(2022)]NJI74040.1 hypothetical protein [Sphingobacterium sp. B16(2022)]
MRKCHASCHVFSLFYVFRNTLTVFVLLSKAPAISQMSSKVKIRCPYYPFLSWLLYGVGLKSTFVLSVLLFTALAISHIKASVIIGEPELSLACIAHKKLFGFGQGGGVLPTIV